eukprot:TRINITY_DN10242_c0_g1_i1.p1 TRINITY_DN10242_c0_g1~~TRINITY_DN10242_c0_g1_i1.p1  ORF type:complete len:290 (+),score=45.90 TRINITY_DN10242_c0_g1_i1:10-879(+)
MFIDFGKDLPKPVFCHILSYLSDIDIARAKLVSSKWYNKTKYDPLWTQLSKNFLKFERGMDDKENINSILQGKNNHSSWFDFYKHLKTSRYLICVAGGGSIIKDFMLELNKHLPFPADLHHDSEYEFNLELLLKYNSVLFFSQNSFFNDDVTKGNLLYDYVSMGGGAVIMCYTTCGCPLLGKWEMHNMTPVKPEQSSRSPNLYLDLEKSEKDHPTLLNVKQFKHNKENGTFGPGELNKSSKVIARYNNDNILIAEKILANKKGFGKVLALNTIGTSNKFSGDGWDESSD